LQSEKILLYLPIVIIALIAPIPFSTSPQEYVLHLFYLLILLIAGIIVGSIFRKNFSLKWKKAREVELKTEDSVLLRGMGFFQSTLFIYLRLIEDTAPFTTSPYSQFVVLLKWSIPFVTAIFFCVRGFGSIKGSPKHRLYSTLILIQYAFLEIIILMVIVIGNNFPIYVGSLNILIIYLPLTLNLAFFSYLEEEVRRALRIRYGLKKK
jgi:hypothetical protein